MPPHKTVRLGLESLEAREVPATFGGSRGLSVAYGDIIPVELDGGQAEYITGTGPGYRGAVPGEGARVRVWDSNGNLVNSITPFGGYNGGVFVDTGDVDGDGQLDLIVSTAGKTSGRVQVYSFVNGGPNLLVDFMPFGALYTGPIQIASGDVTGGFAEEIIVAQGAGGQVVRVFQFDPIVSEAFQIRSFKPYEQGYTGGVTLASDNIFNFASFDRIITGRASQLPQVKIFNAENSNVVQTASYMAFDTRIPANRRGIDVAAGSTDGRIVNNVLFLSGAEIYVGLRGLGTIRVFRGDTGGIVTTITRQQLFPPSYSTSVNFAVGFPTAGSEATAQGNLIVVGANGPFEQVPVVFPGGPQSPAGLNGSFPAA